MLDTDRRFKDKESVIKIGKRGKKVAITTMTKGERN